MSKKSEVEQGDKELPPRESLDDDIDADINVDEIVRIISPEKIKSDNSLMHAMVAGASGGRKEPARTTGPPTSERPKTAKAEEESIERLASKIDEVYQNLDDLSKGIVQVNTDLKGKIGLLTAEMDRLVASLKDATHAVEHASSNIPSAISSPQAGQRQEREAYTTPPAQQPPQQQSYQPPAYGYQSTPPPQQSYYQQPPQQQGYYSQSPQRGFFQQQQPPPPPPGASPEEAVTKGAESLRGTVFDDVVSAMNQVASIVFSRLLDAREKILRIDPSFPVQEFEPVLSELRANPRMKLSQVDKRKLIDRMLFWVSRLPRPP